ncbi:cell division protein FtsA [Zunongwangia profunda]|uniref:cell division protein FtsA n=1 Tax=Zunongwangia profunda TaxID=398743 RepID=UPI001D186988|nr:cell division protein FtsA [Zunongwangia profunda]MCC4227854.1 cell division FtsA domain-containing protein [Zunongwangia profunda]|tara:strand:- start:92 stop:3553 length:3462 start_codon:yes stop_codon:yes gene_type:complete
MDNKIFGYGKNDGKHWFTSDAYSDKEIESIKDPEGGSEISLPTAIPSPFARIDLVKTAFRNISKSPDLKANTKDNNVVAGKDDEKLVSDTLDLAELLFNIDSIKKKVKIIVWDRETELAKLKNGSTAHRHLAETLELYLDQDKESYNFDLLERFYLVEYNHKIIGCTSPATLFFATANNLSHAQITFTKNDVIFDDSYAPLYERDADFQKYFYLLFKANPVLSQRLTVLNDYLDKNLKILDRVNNRLYEEIKNLDVGDFISNYSELDTGHSGDVIEVVGVPLRKRKKEDVINAVQSSDFIIQSPKCKDEAKPLVLQNNLTKPFRYVNDEWDNAIQVPFADSESVLEKRRLPGISIQYPYLTVSDFLEPHLIRLVYPINKEKFFDGNVNTEVGNDSKGYILPLKQKFFDYFNSEDLLNSSQNNPEIKMVQGAAGSVKVTLRIPIAKQGEYIYFERTYYQSPDNQIGKPDEIKNKGVIVEHQFGITLFPFIKTNDPNIEAHYRVQLVDRDVAGVLKNTNYDLKFFSNSEKDPLEIRAKKRRSSKRPDAGETATSDYYVLHNEFDFIQVKNIASAGASGMIIPNWQQYQQGNEVFSFAVDFGTTNTHIEYKVGDGSPKAFDISSDDIQIATLYHPSKTTDDFGGSGAIAIRELIEHEFVPRIIGNGSEFKFPHRTVIAESHSLNVDTETFSLADFNIPFIYERKPEKDKIQSNLKWAKKEKGNEKRVRAFFEKIIMLMRNKVLFNKGNLSKTQLVWFYPSSMKPARKSDLEHTWNELFKQYFNPTNQAVGITESLAPFYYFKGTNKLQGGAFKPVLSIDIGGGTTDVVVFKQNKPLLLSSFKFAANTIFGDGFSEYGAATSNGLISKYYPHFENLLATNKLYDLSNVLSSIRDKNRTEDLNALFFSIEDNPKIKDKKLFSYNSLLSKDDDLKIIFIYFYTAIIYHIAELMKLKEVELPKHIIFSGTGSKILNIISSDKKILSNFSKAIFENVYDRGFDSDGLSIETEKDMPKEVTCKGGLMLNPEDLAFDIRKIRTTLTCVENKGIGILTYDRLDEDTKANIVTYVNDFNKFFLSLNQRFSFSDYFNVSEESLKIFKEEANKHLRDYLEEGLEYNKKLDNIGKDNKEIEESLFFYPLIGAINNLSSHLSQLTPINS